MKETNFRLIEIRKEESQTFNGLGIELELHALYDTECTLERRQAILNVLYKTGEEIKLESTRLDTAPLLPTPKTTVYFKNNLPVRRHTYIPHPYPTQPNEIGGEVGPNFLMEESNYKAMVELIPDSEPIKRILERLVEEIK